MKATPATEFPWSQADGLLDVRNMSSAEERRHGGSSTTKAFLPPESWATVASFVEGLNELSVTSSELNKICQTEAKKRLFKRCGIAEVNSKLVQRNPGFIRLLNYPKGKFAIIPCLSVPLQGTIKSTLLFVADGIAQLLMDEFYRWSGLNPGTHIFAIVSDHTVETTLEPSTAFKGSFLRRCGIVAYEADPESHSKKRIEVQLRGVFNGKLRLFGVPFIIVVPRICDRKHVHQAVWKKLLPFIRNAGDYPLPPYKLVAYNINVEGHWNEVAFTPDYMVVDSQMHAIGERFTLIVDFGTRATQFLNLDMFGDSAPDPEDGEPLKFVPLKYNRLIANLTERDCGVRIV